MPNTHADIRFVIISLLLHQILQNKVINVFFILSPQVLHYLCSIRLLLNFICWLVREMFLYSLIMSRHHILGDELQSREVKNQLLVLVDVSFLGIIS